MCRYGLEVHSNRGVTALESRDVGREFFDSHMTITEQSCERCHLPSPLPPTISASLFEPQASVRMGDCALVDIST